MKNPNANRASSLPTFWLCPSSWADIDTPEPERDKSAANLGTEVHAVVAERLRKAKPAELTLPRSEAEPLVETAMEAWESIKGEVADKGEYCVEPEVVSREPLLSGHMDVLGLGIVDWKSGWLDADYSAQTKGYAWLEWVSQGRPSEFSIPVFTVWLRTHKYDREVYTATDLMAWQAEYEEKLTQIGEVHNPGEACLWCPRKHECADCKAWLAESHAMILSDGAALVTREQMAEAWPRLQELSKAVEEAKKRVRAAAEEAPLDLGGEYELRITGGTRTKIDAEAAWPVLQAHLPAEELSRCVTIRKGETLKAVREQTPKGAKKKEQEAAFMAKLADAGALTKEKTAGQLRRVKKEETDG